MKKPIVYLIGVTAGAPGSTVSARLRVDTDGYHEIYKTVSAGTVVLGGSG